jgi:hypothetical protein
MASTSGCAGSEAVAVGVGVGVLDGPGELVGVGVSVGDGGLDGGGVFVGPGEGLGSAVGVAVGVAEVAPVAVGAGTDATGEGVAGGDTVTQAPASTTTSATAAVMEAWRRSIAPDCRRKLRLPQVPFGLIARAYSCGENATDTAANGALWIVAEIIAPTTGQTIASAPRGSRASPRYRVPDRQWNR